MIEELKQKMEEEIIKLPKEKQEAISFSDWEKKTEDIGKKHFLIESELADFQLETGLVLLGLVSLDLYTNNIENNVGTSRDEAEQITSEVFNEIFTPMANYTKTPNINKQLVFDQNFSSLPQHVQEAIVNSNWKEKLYEIAGKYKLTISQMGTLEEITIKVITNEIHSDKYEEELSSKITILREDISNLVKDVNEVVLRKIRESMREQRGIITNEEKIPLPPYANLIKNEEKVPESYKPTEFPIENVGMPENTPKNIAEEKLKSATMSNHNVSDYSTPKTHDPYREAF